MRTVHSLAVFLVLAISIARAQDTSAPVTAGQGGDGGGTGGGAAVTPTAVVTTPEVQTTQAPTTTQQPETTAAPVTTTAPAVDTNTTPAQSPTQAQPTTQAVVTQQTTQQAVPATTQTTQVQVTSQSTIVVNGTPVVTSAVVVATQTTTPSGMQTVTRPTSVSMQVQTNDAGSVLIVVEGLTTTVAPESASSVQASISSASLAGTLNSDKTGSSDSGGSSNKVWVIPVAVIGGIIGLCALAWIGFRLFKSKFTGLDDDADFIKWPELKTSTDEVLMPQGARHLAGSGVDFGSDEGDDHGKSPMTLSRNSSMMFGSPVMGSASGHSQPPAQQAYYDQQRMSYYDPYLGQGGQSQEGMVERRASNLSYAPSQAHSLPPGAALQRPFSPAQATTAGSVYDDQYRSTTPVPMPDQPLLDRGTGTVRSIGSGTKLGIANPSQE